jgi:hypothetical protein
MKRSDVRYACTRAKNGNASGEFQLILDQVKALLAPHQRWDNFKTVWDVLIDRSGGIVIIKPETDFNYIHSTCLEASFIAKKGLSFLDLTERQANIVTIVEASMLDSLMTWENYNNAWGIEVDQDLKSIKTKLYNVQDNQITVTDEMIEASKKTPEGITAPIEERPVTLTAQPMTDEQIKTFNKMLKSKSKKKG